MKYKLLSILALAGLLQAQTMQFTEYVQVSSSTPEYQTTRASIPYQDCRNEQVYNDSVQTQNQVGGSILGGVLGGVIGHQIGDGKGNDIATAQKAIEMIDDEANSKGLTKKIEKLLEK